MAAFRTKVVALILVVLPSLLLLQTSTVAAVDFFTYDADGCSGTVSGSATNTDNNVCYSVVSAGGIEVTNLLNGETAIFYTGGGCTTEVASLNGPNGGECYYNDAFSGASWYYNT